MSPALSENLTASRRATALLAVCACCALAWAASRFMTPRPSWAHDMPVLGLVCAALAGVLQRNAARARRQSRDSIG